jgi:hypothetical protein
MVQPRSVVQRGTGCCDPFSCIRPALQWLGSLCSSPSPAYTQVPNFYVAKEMQLSGSALVKARSAESPYTVEPVTSDNSELNEALSSWKTYAETSRLEDHLHMIKMVTAHKGSHSVAVARNSSGIQGVVLYKALRTNAVKLEDAVGNPQAKGVSKALLRYVANQVGADGEVELVAANENAFGVWGHFGFETITRI